MKKNYIIVVEGKSDEAKIKSIFPDSNVVVTNGLKLGVNKLEYIKSLSVENNIIIFTDPDWAGNKIREKINKYLDNNCLNAFISSSEIKNKKKGVAEASDSQIKRALENLVFFNDIITISWEDFLKNDFFKPEYRKIISKHFGLELKISVKKFYKYINYLKLNVEKINEIIKDNHD